MQRLGDRLLSWASILDDATRAQAELAASLPFVRPHLALMPDAHLGRGATVGSVLPTVGAVIPAAVGVDIGCGMIAVRTQHRGTELAGRGLAALRRAIERAVPLSAGRYNRTVPPGSTAHRRVGELRELAASAGFDPGGYAPNWPLQLGTLGGGNHFIELCLDQSGNVWVMLHSGSRNIGKTIGETAISMARDIAERKERKLRDRDLAWLDEGTVEFDMYVEGLRWAQDYAAHNRALMLHAVLNALHQEFGREVATFENAVQCHHNYANVEEHFGQQVWVTRKGAVSARSGELGIIPGSMGAKSFIVRGKGNADSYCSCSHGAGRRMSRGAAKRTFSLADLKEQTAGVECRKDAGVLDEIPGAYKSIDAVMAAQAELVDVMYTLKQVMCIKG